MIFKGQLKLEQGKYRNGVANMSITSISSLTNRKRVRKSFGRIAEVAPMPNLIEVQKSSYDHFLQMGVPNDERQDVGRSFQDRFSD